MTDGVQDAPHGKRLVELLRAAAHGDKELLERLVAHIQPDLLRAIDRLNHGHSLRQERASDVLQKTLVKVWKNAGGFRGENDKQLWAWLMRITENEFRDAVRHQNQAGRDDRRDVPLAGDTAKAEPEATIPSPSQHLLGEEEAKDRERALNELSPKYQEVIRLRFHAGHDFAEIARKMTVTEANARKLFQRAVKKWKETVESRHAN
jgi:RNA polymerase sigma-70 factor (ECF subfamily)